MWWCQLCNRFKPRFVVNSELLLLSSNDCPARSSSKFRNVVIGRFLKFNLFYGRLAPPPAPHVFLTLQSNSMFILLIRFCNYRLVTTWGMYFFYLYRHKHVLCNLPPLLQLLCNQGTMCYDLNTQIHHAVFLLLALAAHYPPAPQVVCTNLQCPTVFNISQGDISV